MLGIRLFGYLEAVKGKEPPIRKFRSRSAGEVLAYLSVAMPRPVSREEVATTIWPEDDPDQARSSLRTALYSLRKQLGLPDDPSGPLGSDRQFVWLNPAAVETDLLSFQSLVDQAQALEDPTFRSTEFHRAISMVRGPLLEGLEATWTLPHQLAFEESYCNTVTNLIEVLTATGSAGLAVEIGRAALKVVPLREDVHLALIRSLGADGRISEALRQFEVLEELLLDHWGEYPSEQTVEAIQQLGQAGPRTAKRPKNEDRELVGFETSRGWVLGRDAEVNSLLLELQDANGSRLLTLVGTGGCGKTTLAHAVAEKLSGVMPVRFIEMSAAREVRTVISLAARALELLEPNSPDAFDRIRKYFTQQPMLLILDNAEHLLPAISGVISSWVQPDQAGRLLVTSRAPLSIAGEQQVHLRPFSTPSRTASLSALTVNPAVGLFVLKAKVADPDFELTSQNATAVAEICSAMDGLPLAITLAASHVALMTPAQILKKLQDDRFRITALGSASTDRHSSVERAVRWSYDLLSEPAQELFCRLGVCRGDFSLELAESLQGGEVQESLVELIRASLLERTSEDDTVRFRMLIPIRSFALERLRESGLEDETRSRLLDYCHGLADWLRWEFQGPNPAAAFAAAERELDHFRQLSDHALATHKGLGKAIKCAFCLGTFFAMGWLGDEWAERISRLVEMGADSGTVNPHDMACGFAALAQIKVNQTQQREARRWLKQALGTFEQEGNPINLAGALNLLAMTYILPSDTRDLDVARALETLDRSAALLGNAVGRGEWSAEHLRIATLSNLAAAYRMVGRHDEAVDVLTEALALAKRAHSKRLYPVLLLGIADNHMELDHNEEAVTIAEEAHHAAMQAGITVYATGARFTQAWSLLNLGRYDDAAQLMCSSELAAVRATVAYEGSVIAFILSTALYHLGHEALAREGYTLAQRLGFQHGIMVRQKYHGHPPEFMRVQTIRTADLAPGDPLVEDFYRRAEATFSKEST